MFLMQKKYLSALVLADWTANFDVSTNWNYIGYYSLLALACSMAGMLSQIGSQYRAAAASKQIHAALLERTMHAPVNINLQQTRQTLKTRRVADEFLRDNSDWTDSEQILL